MTSTTPAPAAAAQPAAGVGRRARRRPANKGSFDPWPKYPANRGIIFALVTLGVVVVWFACLRLRHPERVPVAAAHAAEHHGVPPLDETLQFQPAAEPGLGEATLRDTTPNA